MNGAIWLIAVAIVIAGSVAAGALARIASQLEKIASSLNDIRYRIERDDRT